jgi:asparagine synthase (glutamine-hydrolysing)
VSGVAGVVEVGGGPRPGGVLDRMVGAVPYRGGGVVWVAGGVGLAGLGGGLAVHEAAGVVAVADVRLDNREVLLAQLGVAPGCGDVELIVAAYLRWGAGCAARLLGDFAFVVWDGRQRRVVAARDAMGMRALYWHHDGRRLVVGTEIKQLLAAGVPARLFEPAVAAHLAGCFGPVTWSCYEGVEALAPAHVLEVDERGVRTWRYWDIDPERRIRYRDEREYAEHLRALLVASVRARLGGPGPVGVMLSGGMDSGAVASTAGWLRQREPGLAEVRAYCWAFRELPQCDERHISRGITEHYGLPEVAVEADDAWPLKDYPAHGPDRDEPFVGVYQPLIDRTLVMARAQGVTTMLGGDRGDLMIGTAGLDYLTLARHGRWRVLGAELAQHRAATGETLPAILTRYLGRPAIDHLQAAPRRTWAGRLARTVRPSPPASPRLPAWIDERFARRTGLHALDSDGPDGPSMGFARSLRYRSVMTPLHMRGMTWSERTYAQNGISFADPWSDRRIAEFAVAIPQQVVTRPGTTEKRLAREAMAGIMPDAVRIAVRKIVPQPLYERALRELETATVWRLLDDPLAARAGYVDPVSLREGFAAHLRGAPLRPDFWWALTLEMWLRQHLA